MGWIGLGIAVAGFFIGLGIEGHGKCMIMAYGKWDEYEAFKAKKEAKEK